MIYPSGGVLFSHKKKNKVLIDVLIRMDLENTVLCEISHKQEDKYCMSPLIGKM